MANQVPSSRVHVSEGSAKEESGLSAAFWQERYDAKLLYLRLIPDAFNAVSFKMHTVTVLLRKEAQLFHCLRGLIGCCKFCRYGENAVGPVRTLPVMRSFTFLRLIPDMMSPEYQAIWFRFMDQMQQPQSRE